MPAVPWSMEAFESRDADENSTVSASLGVGALKTGWISLVGNKVNIPKGISPHSFVVSFTLGVEECRILRT